MSLDCKSIYLDFQKLIAESCNFEEKPSQHFQEFHCDFLKFFFNVLQVRIDYQNKSIVVRSPKPINDEPFTFYNIDASVTGAVNYVNLEATLLGCMEEGQLQSCFYKQLIKKYGENDQLEHAS